MSGRILVIDDEPTSIRLLDRILSAAGFTEVEAHTSAAAAIESWNAMRPALVLLDLHMPEPDGFALLRHMNASAAGEFIPIVVLTGDSRQPVRQQALDMGAHDYITKPFDAAEVVLRIRNLLRTRSLTLRLREANEALEERVRERTAELEAARGEALEKLARAAEYRDDATGQHARRVGLLAAAIAARLGCADETVALMRRAAPLHDLGKIGVPDGILLKAGALLEPERAIIQTHTTIGASILAGSRSSVFALAAEIARTHHERWDGCGYPEGLAGTAIPLSGRIVAAADTYDALTHGRPYKEAVSSKEALAVLESESGLQFDPAVVAALLAEIGAAHAADRSARGAQPVPHAERT